MYLQRPALRSRLFLACCAELCSGAALLVTRLHQQGVAPAVLLQCSSAGDAAAGLAAVQAAAEAAAAPLSVTQPGQFAVALRLALDQLDGAAPSDAVFVSVSDSSSWASQAAELGCATEHLPARSATPGQLQAWALQAVACHAGAQQARQALVVGYVMKESRQLALSQQGMLPLLPPAAAPPPAGTPPAAPGMCFVPLDLGSSLQHQLQRCQLVLQKLTDCLQPGGGSGAVAALTAEATALLACLDQQQAQHAQQQAPCLVDPIAALRLIMDRALLAEHLEAAALAVRQQAIPMRAPASVLLRGFDSDTTPRQLAAAGVALPCIVKPQAACGIAEAHQMAFVLHRCASSQLVGLWLASQPACLTVLPGWPSCFRCAAHGTGAWLIPPHPPAPPAPRLLPGPVPAAPVLLTWKCPCQLLPRSMWTMEGRSGRCMWPGSRCSGRCGAPRLIWPAWRRGWQQTQRQTSPPALGLTA